MTEAITRDVRTNGIALRVTEQGTGYPVALCHGFPELAYSWCHQVRALAEAGYDAFVPDQRGYGGSARPIDIESRDLTHWPKSLPSPEFAPNSELVSSRAREVREASRRHCIARPVGASSDGLSRPRRLRPLDPARAPCRAFKDLLIRFLNEVTMEA